MNENRFALISTLCLLVAFFTSLYPLAFYETISVLVCFVSVVFAFLSALKGQRKIPLKASVPGITGLLFWGVAALSVIFSEVPIISFTAFSVFSLLPFSFLTCAIWANNKVFKKSLFIGGGVIALALSLTSLWQVFFKSDMLFHGSVHWPLANPNMLAALLLLLSWGGLGVMTFAENKYIRVMGAIIAGLLVSAFLMTGGRAAMVSVCIPLFVFFYYARQAIWNRKIIWGVFIVLILGFGVISSTVTPDAVQTPMETVGTLSKGTKLLGVRPAIRNSALEIIKENIFTGTGIGTFFLYYPSVRGGDLRSAGYMVHSDPLQFMAEMGLFSSILFYILIVSFFIKFLLTKPYIVEGDNAAYQDDSLVLTLACALATLVIHAHVSFPFYVIPILIVFGISAGTLYAKLYTFESEGQGVSQEMCAGLAIVPVIWLFAFSSLQMSSALIEEANKSFAKGDMQDFASLVNQASDISHGYNEKAYILAASIPFGILEDGGSKTKSEKETLGVQIFGLLDKAAKLNPRNPMIPYLKARVLKHTSVDDEDHDGQEKYLKESLSLNPGYFQARVALSEFYQSKGERKKALDILNANPKWPSVHQKAFFPQLFSE